jgi:lipoprotein signal peptidase
MGAVSRFPYWLVTVLSSVIVFDQLTKIQAESFELATLNAGISFGLGQSLNQGVIMGITVGVLLAAALSFKLTWEKHPVIAGLFFGGGVSNLIDRVLVGAVRDWIPVPFLEVHNNLADWAIGVAVLLLVGQLLTQSLIQYSHDSAR